MGKNLFTDYDGFVGKFKPKKTTDDCYTPQAVYDVVLAYVGKHYNLTDKVIMRPFYPGGNFEAEYYPSNAVVVDNPPFSILSKIVRFYSHNKIPFFLFAPTLTLFACSGKEEVTFLPIGANVIYENGAVISTSFVTNMMGDALIVVDGDFREDIEAVGKKKGAKRPKYKYPDNVVSAAILQKLNKKGIKLVIKKNDGIKINKLDYQGSATIFGCGILLSSRAAAERAAAERAAAERAAAEEAIIYKLSARELELIKILDKTND
jgi:hypothetical protein